MRFATNDRDFYQTLLQLAIPIALQQLMMSGLNAVDQLIVGQINETAVAAVGLASQILFLLHLFHFGVGSGAAIFSAQFWGRGDRPNVQRVLGLALLLAVGGSLLFALAALLAPAFLLSLYSNDPAVVALGSRYLRLASLSYIPTAISSMYGIILRSTGFVRTPMAVSMGALSFKTALTYALVFGTVGLPALGLEGAGVALTIARWLECIVLVWLTYHFDLPAAARLRQLFDISRALVGRFIRTSLPVIVGEIVWSLGITVYAGIYARISTDSFAAFNIAGTIENVALVPFIALGHTAAVMIGQRIGAGETGAARLFANRFLRLATAGALLMALLMFLLGQPLLGLYRIADATRAEAWRVIIVMVLVLWIKAGNMMMIVGILRSGGDTRFALFSDTGPMWIVGVPLALIGAFVLRLPIYWVVAMVMFEEALKFALSVWRVTSNRWVHDVVKTL